MFANKKPMTLIKSISGIRGTIGGEPGKNLTPIDIVKFTTAFGVLISQKSKDNKKIIVGRDARASGEMVQNIVVSTLQALGFDVVVIGLATTPTTEIAVVNEKAAGGIIITASHNPANWNALKLLDSKGEFLNDKDGQQILEIAESERYNYAKIEKLGKVAFIDNYEDIHINEILNLELVNKDLIAQSNFKVAIDCVNSVGGLAIPKLLSKLGVKNITELYCTPNGNFPHNPEPLPENLTEICKVIQSSNADVGFVVDPDVDRLAIVCEDGSMFGEEYTLVAVADYVLSKQPGSTVSNLSSTQALKDVTESYNQQYYASAVGEVNVVEKMKEIGAVIGGEGNGGVIYPKSHYGRDALVGIALFLSYLAEQKTTVSQIRNKFPNYYISKNKIELNEKSNIEKIFSILKEKNSRNPLDTSDGLKIIFPEKKEWVQLRKSNTEPIIRIYSESPDKESANLLAEKIINDIKLQTQ